MQTRVLVVSASMGAGHDGAARELVRRLTAEGHQAEMRDFLTSGPLRIGDLLRSSYEFQMKYMAWSYDLTYRLLYRLPSLCPPIGRSMARLTAPDLLRWIEESDANVIVSTYPLTSFVLGELRREGRLNTPAINFITDFGIHPFWIHPGIDLNLSVHPRPASLAEARSGRPSIATGPMVSPRFAEPRDRAATRAGLGLQPTDRAVLIVSGSWGVGKVATTFRTLAASEGFVPIVVCGRDERLRERLSRVRGGRVLGWTDDMPALMAAADALVENAGGLTAMEALSVGLPIISFRPIAGHGKMNTAEMQTAGVSRVARTPGQLLRFLEQVTTAGPARQAMVDAGQAMFVADPAGYVKHAARVGAARLGDRQLLATVATTFGEFDPAQVAGAADRVDFDPAEELRALVAGTKARRPAPTDPSDPSDPSYPGDAAGPLAPVVPIGHRRRGEPAATEADDEAAMPVPASAARAGRPGEELAPTGTDGAGAQAPRTPPRRPARPSMAIALLAALVAAIPLIWAGLTSGVAFATSLGAGVAHPAPHSGNVAYIGVRLDPSQLTDLAIVQKLAAIHASAVVDEQTAANDPAAVQRLVTMGINVENGGAGERVNAAGHRIDEAPWKRAAGDVGASQVLAQIAGQPVRVFVPGRRINAWDLVACDRAHNETVVPNHILQPADDDALHLSPRHTYLVNGTNATDQQMEAMLSQLQSSLATSNLAGAPLSALI